MSRIRQIALLGSCAAALCTSSGALAQAVSTGPYPVRQFEDENGVDLFSRLFTAMTPGVTIGSAEDGLSYTRNVRGNTFRDTMMGNIDVNVSTYTVAIGARSEQFTLSGGVFTSVEANGSTLSLSGNIYTYRLADGTVATFYSGATIFFGNARGIVIQTLTDPSGRSIYFQYHEDSFETDRGQTRHGRRLQGVSNNAGWQLNFQYSSDVASLGSMGSWSNMVTVKGLNSSVDSCALTAFSCPQTGRPQLDIANPSSLATDYTDAEGRTTRYTQSGGQVTGVRLPGSTSDDIAVTYSSGLVSSITRFGVTTGYASADASGVRTVTVTRPGGATRVATFDITKSLLLSDQNELGQVTSYQYDSNNRLTRITRPEGNYIQFTYDARGNVTETRHVAKSGSGAADIVTTASYPSSCTNAVTCNRPAAITDPRGNTTDYTYDGTHGGLLSVTGPAPTSGAPRPEIRVAYTRLGANGAPSGTGVFKVTGSSTCRTGAAPGCVGTADEQKASLAYGPGLLPSSATVELGNATLTATQAMTWDVAGNLVTVDGPLPGTADTTRARYNLARQIVGVVGPDPDGAGAAKHPATRYSYNAKGEQHLTELGTVNGQTDTDWANFAQVSNTLTEFDANRRAVRVKLRSGTTDYRVSDMRYDSRGRVECSIQRMDPANWGTAASSCTPPQASDRVTYSHYDVASRVVKVTEAYGTSDAADAVVATFTTNGRLATLTDAEANRTTYEHDGHDRTVKVRYPVTTKGAHTSSTTDYEELTYDAAGNVLTFRTRRAESIGYTYDNLGRLTVKDVPTRSGLASTHTRDVYFGYDLMGNMTFARFDSAGGEGITNVHNALGQLTSTTTDMDGVSRQLAYQYDIAGNLTRITHPDGNYVQYARHAAGALDAASLNGSSNLFRPVLDAVGRLSTLERHRPGTGWSQPSSYTYDAVSRLASLGLDPASSTYDSSTTFTYNPANQIASQTRGNDLYAWGGQVNADRAYTASGLNQYTAITGLSSLTYDANGNLTGDGTDSYIYDVENRLVTRSGGASTTLRYDPLGRLYESAASSGTRRFLYSGSDLVGEYNTGGTLLRRYVHGLGAGDDPMVWFEGAGIADTARRYLYADERGSVVAVTDSAGTVLGVNAYDESGIPQSGNLGAFQYTGQVWLPELGMYYYKARMYSPTLGRFMQTDPIGYGDGMNMFAYVGNDPVNSVDPSGKIKSCLEVQCILVEAQPCPSGWECLAPGVLPRLDEFPSGAGAGGGGSSRESIIVRARKKRTIILPPGNEPQSTEERPPCPLPADVARAYRGARNTAFRLFNGSREIGYTIFRSNESGALHISFTAGVDGAIPSMTLRIPGQTLVLTGHIHNNGVGPKGFLGLGGWVHRGPSDPDVAARSHFPSAAFVLHENVGGEWKDSCY